VLRQLNERFQDDSDALKYFTIIYGVVDAEQDIVQIAQAGHPTPLLQTGSDVTRTGDSGFPVGMLPDLEYEQAQFAFAPGDRLFLYSDGVTECANEDREQFKLERLEACLRSGRLRPLESVVNTIEHELRHWRGTGEFEDDVTLLALERRAA
jgi:sigma-B regulation protein RsbU (phosphoserine phosphatase)